VARRSTLTALTTEAREALGDNQKGLINDLAYAIGFEGMPVNAAAERFGFEPKVVRKALAFIPQFRDQVDMLMAVRHRELLNESAGFVEELQKVGLTKDEDGNLVAPSMTGDEMRMANFWLSLVKEHRSGEREEKRRPDPRSYEDPDRKKILPLVIVEEVQDVPFEVVVDKDEDEE